jgi:hypothetical protein
VNLLGGCCEGENAYLVYEYVQGSSLGDFWTDKNDHKNNIFIAIIIGHQRVRGCNYSVFNNVNLYDRFILIFGGLHNRRLHILQEGMHSFPSDIPLRTYIFLKDILKSTVCLVSSVKRVGHTTWYFF